MDPLGLKIAEINTARNSASTTGTNTAALMASGYNGTANVTVTESWNGSAWTEVNDLPTARGTGVGVGVQTANLAVGGTPNAPYAKVFSFDGTNRGLKAQL